MNYLLQFSITTFFLTILLVNPTESEFHANSNNNKLDLKISCETDTLFLSNWESPKVKISIHNSSKRTQKIVKPGDGSSRARRTPLVGWSIIFNNVKAVHPKSLNRMNMSMMAGCGNINPLKSSELVVLRPNKNFEMEWPLSVSKRVGKYRVKFYYENEPKIEWKGIPLGAHDRNTMTTVKNETEAFELKSNELIFEVVN